MYKRQVDESAQGAGEVQPRAGDAGSRLLGAQGLGVEADGHPPQGIGPVLAFARGHAHEGADDVEGEGFGEVGDHVDLAGAVDGGQQPGDAVLDRRAQPVDRAGGERRGDARAQAPVRGRVDHEERLRLGVERAEAEALVAEHGQALGVAGDDDHVVGQAHHGPAVFGAQPLVEGVGVGVEVRAAHVEGEPVPEVAGDGDGRAGVDASAGGHCVPLCRFAAW